MHVRGERSWPNYPVGGNAVGRGVEPVEGHTKFVMTAATFGLVGFIKLLVLLTHSVRLWWGRRLESFLPGDKKKNHNVIKRQIN